MDIAGAKIHKMTVVKDAFSSEKMSTDRLRRVRGYGRFANAESADDFALDESTLSRLVFGNDPFIAVVKMPTNIKGK